MVCAYIIKCLFIKIQEISSDGIDNSCKLTINSVDTSEHYGEWTCTISDPDFGAATVSAKIIVDEPRPAMVEFENYYGEVYIDAAKQNVFPLRCNAIPEELTAKPFSTPPGKKNKTVKTLTLKKQGF